jgi:uncharacterized protein YcgI (DUF1989 family)
MTGSLYEHTLEPGTGKAVPVLRGQVFRLEQLVGGQCADFNVFNLHDYKERFDAGRTRRMHGNYPRVGDMLWSAPPRDRPMMAFIADTVGANDISYQRCSALTYEYQFGVLHHTNCQDIQAEAQREFGLTPDDVHDSCNLFMAAGINTTGAMYISTNPAKAGDYVELMAQIDVLAVPNVCGSDMISTSNFELNPLRLAVRESTEAERAKWLLPEKQYRSQRSVDTFRVKSIRLNRELERDVTYTPQWDNFPIVKSPIRVEFSDAEYELVESLRTQAAFGDTDGSVVRAAFFSWWTETRRKGQL